MTTTSQPISLLKQSFKDFLRVWNKIGLVVLIYMLVVFGISLTGNWLTEKAILQLPSSSEISIVGSTLDDQMDLDSFSPHLEEIQARLKMESEVASPISNSIMIANALTSLLFAFFISAIVSYQKQNVPDPFTFSAFKNYALAIIWKYLRPILWLLLPIIGAFFYFNALLRYELVGPLALANAKEPLKESRALTEGNVWRLIGIYSVISLLPSLSFCLFDLPHMIHALTDSSGNLFVHNWSDLFWGALTYSLSVSFLLVFSFTARDVFQHEKDMKDKTAETPPSL